MRKETAKVNMDDKQRVCLTRVLSKVERELFSSFRIYRDGGKIVLEPLFEIPRKDHWIYHDPEAFSSLMEGIKDAEEGKLNDLGSFAQYVIEKDEHTDEIKVVRQSKGKASRTGKKQGKKRSVKAS